MDRRLKVAIIGAGAVGLYLAWKLSQEGHFVVVYEKKMGIKAKACSGLVSESFLRRVPGIADFSENRIEVCRIHFPQKTVQLRFSSPHLAVCRQEINERLFELAKSAGVSFVWLHPFESVKETIGRFDRVIGCDGAYSSVRRTLGLPDPEMKQGLQAFAAIQDDSRAVDVWPAGSGFLWRIPRGKHVEYGIMDDKKSALTNFLAYAEKLGVLYRLGGIRSAPIPCGLRIPDHPKITLCGDAAGITKPWSGGGLLWGFHAADILADSFPDFAAYRERAQRFFLPHIAMGKAAASFVHWAGTNEPFLIPSKIGYDNDFMPFLPKK